MGGMDRTLFCVRSMIHRPNASNPNSPRQILGSSASQLMTHLSQNLSQPLRKPVANCEPIPVLAILKRAQLFFLSRYCFRHGTSGGQRVFASIAENRSRVWTRELAFAKINNYPSVAMATLNQNASQEFPAHEARKTILLGLHSR
jgi:hypothetical protein